MNYANVISYAIDVIGLFEHPGNVEKALRPDSVVAVKWVPQTITDEIWVFYEFPALKDKKDFAKVLRLTQGVRILNLPDEEIKQWVS